MPGFLLRDNMYSESSIINEMDFMIKIMEVIEMYQVPGFSEAP